MTFSIFTALSVVESKVLINLKSVSAIKVTLDWGKAGLMVTSKPCAQVN